MALGLTIRGSIPATIHTLVKKILKITFWVSYPEREKGFDSDR